MLNSASTRLACLEDVEVDVSATGSPARLFRRRVFAPEDNRDERFLTASDVVKVCATLLTLPTLVSSHCPRCMPPVSCCALCNHAEQGLPPFGPSVLP